MPGFFSIIVLPKRFSPLTRVGQNIWNVPPKTPIPEPHADKVSLLPCIEFECIASVQHRQVIDKVQIPYSCGDFKTILLSKCLENSEGFYLARRHRGNICWSRVSSASEEGTWEEIEDEMRVMVEQDGAFMIRGTKHKF